MKKPKAIWHPSPNFRPRSHFINAVILHGTGMKSDEEVLERLCCEKHEVSAHYFISSKGELYQLVDETKMAWHAGVSSFGNMNSLNFNAIGIEIFNPKAGNGRKYKECQYETLYKLLAYLIDRYHIPLQNVLGHSDISCVRESNFRTDPGYNFEWKRLYKRGLAMPIPKLDDVSEAALKRIGYKGSYAACYQAYLLRHGLNPNLKKHQLST